MLKNTDTKTYTADLIESMKPATFPPAKANPCRNNAIMHTVRVL